MLLLILPASLKRAANVQYFFHQNAFSKQLPLSILRFDLILHYYSGFTSFWVPFRDHQIGMRLDPRGPSGGLTG